MKLWINDIQLRKITLKAIHVISASLLQKISKSSKSEDRHAALERTLNFWVERKIEELLYEGQAAQERLKSPNSSMKMT